ncbi:MAG: ABC transporter ATP-binding protein [Lachnospiraceae bacterium]
MSSRTNPQTNQDTFQTYIHTYCKFKNHPVRILFSFFQGSGWSLLFSLIALTLKESIVWVLPIVTSNITNFATYSGKYSVSYFWTNIGIAALFLVLNFIAACSYSRIYDKLVRNIEMNLRTTLVRKLQQLSITKHKDIQSGRLQSKIMRDVENVETVLQQTFMMIVFVVLDIIVIMGITAKNSMLVLCFFLITIPFAAMIINLFRKPIRGNNRNYRVEVEKTQAAMAEMVEMIPVTRAHGLEDVEITKIDRQLERVREHGFRLDFLNTIFGTSSWMIFQFFQLACLAFTGYMAYKGRITVGEVVLYQSYFTQLIGKVNSMVTIYPTLTKGLESVNSIGEILQITDIEDNHEKHNISNLQGAVSIEHVSFHYQDDEKWIFRDFSLDVKPGESIAFVGGSGAGKSTLLNLIIGFDKPDSGRICIDGMDLRECNLHSLREHFAVVPQNTILFSGTIRDNIAYGMKHVSDEEILRVIKEVDLEDLIAELPDGIYTRLGEHGGRLSGGQRQRLCIARAMIRKPSIIIFDEATSALDSISEKKIQTALNRLIAGKTTFMVAHRLSTIQNADRIVLIENGEIAEMGTYEELMEQKGKFYTMRTRQ